jgi:predicted nucleic acid-binding Zn ribbon protein
MQPIRSTLNKIVRDALARASEADAPLFAWPLACGAAVASKTEAISFEKGTLHVVVPDVTWRAQLEDLAPQLVKKLRELVGPAVERIQFELAGQRRGARSS